MKYIVSHDAIQSLKGLGGKVRALGELAHAELNIPPWFAVKPVAFYNSLTPSQQEAFAQLQRPEEIATFINNLTPSHELETELDQALSALCPHGERVAVRSSAPDEDGAEHSFAGQLESFLFVESNVRSVLDKLKAVWLSGFSERVMAYRKTHSLAQPPSAPAVLVQRMVNATAAGVAFSVDPVSGRQGIAVVAAVFGLGETLVSGQSDSDTFHVNREHKVVHRDIARKQVALRFDAAANELVLDPVPDPKAEQPALDDVQAAAVALLARRTAKFFKHPQDIEWALEGDHIYLLQSRPITSLKRLADPDGQLIVWDNSNIAESYGGITTPLTFSFARRAYEEVYRQFCRILRVPQKTIRDNDSVFAQMLGLIQGRVYYNLLSWYKVLALLPGFQTNRKFMEQMMGVQDGVPDELLPQQAKLSTEAWVKDQLSVLGTMAGLVWGLLSLSWRIEDFYKRLEAALGKSPDLSAYRPDELVNHYRQLERQLLTRWDAPLVNDFFAMIFYGLLRKLAEQWCGDEAGTLQNNLLCGEGGMVSTEPAERMMAMAKVAGGHKALTEALRHHPVRRVKAEIKKHPAFEKLYESYLEKFGDRCLDELKLESLNLADDPEPFMRAVGQLAHMLHTQGEHGNRNIERQLRRDAEQVVQQTINSPLKRIVFQWVLGNARARVRDRENLRFERTRVFGRVRTIFNELGRRYSGLGLLDDPHDIVYLEVEEALGFVTGTTTTTNLKALVALRKKEFDAFAQAPAPADRFQTRNMVHQGNSFEPESSEMEEMLDDETLKGLGCCPGKVRAKVRLIHDPRGVTLEPGAILVAERTDPSWIMLFPFAAGVLVERGSLLSHAAIVSREMGIPSIVSIPGLMRWLKDGDEVEVDGSTGIVKRIEQGANRAQSAE